MSNPLNDTNFLIELDKTHNKETFARITALSWQEQPLERIEGQITAGTVNIDGSSTVRRTCSLTLIAQDINIHNYYWGLSTKFTLEVGVKNNINPAYPNIIWFPQGMYIITGFNTSVASNNYTISISGKDKMCMLNGDMGGNLYASVDFGVEEYYDAKTQITTYNKIPIKTIIKNAVNVYGNEPLHNIIITDIDDYGVELLEYRGDESTPLYLLREYKSDFYINMTMNQNQICWYQDEDGNWDNKVKISEIPKYDQRINVEKIVEGSLVKLKNTNDATIYRVHKITYGETVGYRLTDVVYAGDLISRVGESLTSVLDKIKTMLGDFEYFYDLQGRFIFQKKKTYVTNSWNSIIRRDDDMYVESAAYTSASTYIFNDSHYFTAISHNPSLNNLKNDFSIWGNRKSISGADIPIHMRYALDKKPSYYKTWEGIEYYASEEMDWRELIYQMALDYFEHHDEDNFLQEIGRRNPNEYPIGYTGYEIYYTDLQGFWRELYNPNIYSSTGTDKYPIYGKQYYRISDGKYYPVDFETIAVFKEKEDKDYYKIKDGKYIKLLKDTEFEYGEDYYYFNNETKSYIPINIYKFASDNIYWQEDDECDFKTHWNKKVSENPSILNFWFDFLGEGSELDNYLVCNIGDRTKVINDSKITGIYFKDTPSVLFITDDEYIAMGNKTMKTGYTYIRINDSLSNFFSISSQGKSAQDVMEILLYENTYCMENISISAIPIYYLNPNTRIEIHDKESGIEGEYLISRITLPLSYNGTMTITATRAVDTIY